ncbi:glycoside hydrolase family 3 N-terminal domain-containing protein [Treponema sp.]|uniref:glycoside hydrolase family 3 N-terminal domain-containing protein n=1 Tax=Treponema sp. TaxID=166 RepID=UPI00388F91F4
MKKYISLFLLAVLCRCFFFAVSVDEYYEKLSDEEKIFQLFLVNIEGNKTYRSVEFLDDGTPVVPGGVLLFSYNIGDSAEQLMAFNDSIMDYCIDNSITCPYVAVDQEGGEVNRLGGITSTLRSCKRISENYSTDEAAVIYGLQARQMKLLGIHMNLAPVVEPEIDYNREFLSRRSFGSASRSVVYSIKCVRAYEENGIASVVKHFPGNSNTDPHVGLPVISLEQSDFDRNFLIPFAFVLDAGQPTCILMSHAIVDGYGEKIPACLSSFWIEDVLRKRIGYEGLVISDDIFMGALADNGFPPEKAVVQAVEAGVDVIMLSEKKFLDAARTLLNEGKTRPDFKNKLQCAVKRVLTYKAKFGLLDESRIKEHGSIENRMKEFNGFYKVGQTYEK